MGLTAIEPLWRNSEKKGILIHPDVVEVPSGRMNRMFKCQLCGREWIETINSPQIIDDNMASYLKENSPEPIVYCEP